MAGKNESIEASYCATGQTQGKGQQRIGTFVRYERVRLHSICQWSAVQRGAGAPPKAIDQHNRITRWNIHHGLPGETPVRDVICNMDFQYFKSFWCGQLHCRRWLGHKQFEVHLTNVLFCPPSRKTAWDYNHRMFHFMPTAPMRTIDSTPPWTSINGYIIIFHRSSPSACQCTSCSERCNENCFAKEVQMHSASRPSRLRGDIWKISTWPFQITLWAVDWWSICRRGKYQKGTYQRSPWIFQWGHLADRGAATFLPCRLP